MYCRIFTRHHGAIVPLLFTLFTECLLPTLAVLNGHAAPSGKYPFMAAILGSGPNCAGAVCLVDGASVVTSVHVLTSCYATKKIAAYTNPFVYLGHVDISGKDPEYAFGIKKTTCFSSPACDGTNQADCGTVLGDLALIELDRRIDFDRLQLAGPACVPLTDDDAGQLHLTDGCVLLGWGEYSATLNVYSNTLMEASMPLLSNDSCTDAFGQSFNPTQMVCAGQTSAPFSGICYGDAGGPLVCPIRTGASDHRRYCVLGVATFMRDACATADDGRPSVFTRVHSFAELLRKNTES